MIAALPPAPRSSRDLPHDRTDRTPAPQESTAADAPSGIVTISIGAASIVPAKGDNAQRLVEAADAGLYAAKRRGRNMVVAHSELALSQAS